MCVDVCGMSTHLRQLHVWTLTCGCGAPGPLGAPEPCFANGVNAPGSSLQPETGGSGAIYPLRWDSPEA